MQLDKLVVFCYLTPPTTQEYIKKMRKGAIKALKKDQNLEFHAHPTGYKCNDNCEWITSDDV